jgi:hypothetical protein
MQGQVAKFLQFFNENPTENFLPIGLMTSNPDSIPPAAKYVRDDTRQFYMISSNQYTIPKHKNSYDGILNEEGIKLLNETMARISVGNFDAQFEQCCVDIAHSGCWFANTESKYWDTNQGRGSLNAYDNRTVSGWFYHDNIKIMAMEEPLVFYGIDWGLNTRGQLFKFGTFLNSASLNSILSEIPFKLSHEDNMTDE